MEVFGIPVQALLGQLLIGLINGAFYAMLSLGLAVIYGLLYIANFTHGAQYMMGAFCGWLLLTYLGVGYFPALILAPLIVGLIGFVLERLFLRRIYKLDHMYGLLITFGLALIIEGLFSNWYGASGQVYPVPAFFAGVVDLGFMHLPIYRAWVIGASIVICVATWFVIERTRLGSSLRAATENAALVQAFGINVPLMVSLTYAGGIALAALAGVLAAPIYQVSPHMGSNLVIISFAVVVIGGLGSITGAVVSGFALGIIEGLTKVFYPEASNTIIFVIMAIILLVKPAGLFGIKGDRAAPLSAGGLHGADRLPGGRNTALVLLVIAVIAPHFTYPVFLMQLLCFALFASAYNLLAGFGGLLSFGHAAFFGMASYLTAQSLKIWGLPPELAILIGVVTAALLGLVFGLLSVKRQGIYFAMVTLALAQMVYFFCVEAPFTHSDDGIQAIPRGMLFGLLDLNNTLTLYYVVLAIFVIGFAIIYRTIHSPFGHVLKAIRENEPRALSLGYNTHLYKLLAFVLSAALSGLAGSMRVLVFQIAALTDVHWSTSGDVILMLLVGGVGTLLGPLVGAAVMISMENYLADMGAWVTVIQGVIFIACVLTFRRGIVGELLSWLNRRAAASNLQTESQRTI